MSEKWTPLDTLLFLNTLEVEWQLQWIESVPVWEQLERCKKNFKYTNR